MSDDVKDAAPAAAPAPFESLFISGDVTAKDVTMPNGETHALHFKQVPASAFRRYRKEMADDDDAISDLAVPRLISASMCDANGAPVLTVERAATLKPAAMNEILGAVLEVNELGPAAKKG